MRRGTIISWGTVGTLLCAVTMWAAPAGSGSSDRAGIVAPSQTVTASVPPLIRFSAAATDFRSSTQTIAFSLYDSAQSSTPLWSETQQVEIDDQGNYTVMLGGTRPEGLPMDLFTSGRALWLGVQLASEPEQPRTLMVAVPYAFKAADAETLGGLPASAFLLAPQAGTSAVSGGQAGGTSATQPGNAERSSSPLGSGNSTAPTANSPHPVPLVTPCTSVTSDGTGTANQLAKFTIPCNITKSAVFESGGKVGIGTTAPGGTLDVNGRVLVRGTFQLPPKGTATAALGSNSQAEDWQASVFDSMIATPVAGHLLWQAEPVGNNTSSPSAKLSLLAALGSVTPAETGLSISSKGLITFAPGQTFPGTGAGTIKGVTAGTDLSGGGTSGIVTLNLNTALTDARYSRLAASNSFTGNQSVTGNVTASGTLTGKQLVSTAASGTAPLVVTSTKQVLNLNASFLGGFGASAFARLAAANTFTGNQSITGNLSATGTLSAGSTVKGSQLISTVSPGTAPLSVASSTLVPNLNASLLGGLGASSFARLAVGNTFTGNQTIAGRLTGTVASGAAITGNGPTGVLGQGANTAAETGTGGQGVEGNGGSATNLGGIGGSGVVSNGGTGNFFGGAGTTATGGSSSTNGGQGIIGTGGSGPSGGVGVEATGGQSTDGSQNGVGLFANGGQNLGVSPSVGGDGIQTEGGEGNNANGGNGITSTGGAASGAGFVGGAAVMATGGTDLQGLGGAGIAAFGGTGSPSSGFGGDAIDATAGPGKSPGDAGFFNGDVSVSGTLTAAKLVATTTKDFKIEDPVDPTKYLFHASVESSEMMNIYSGMALMDHQGEVVVTLAKWFEALNGDFRYQLTCIGGWAPVYIKRKIDRNQFTIAGGTPGMEVSWQVTGVRHDAAAKAHPLVVEMAKTDDLIYRRAMARVKQRTVAARRPPNPALTTHHPA